ncbi:MAG TPA: glycosyltransferase family 9 protein, partial [Tepidisphaeraceae bacterium]
DAIHFIRYAPLIAKLGAKVMVECPAPLVRLFGNISGIDRIIPAGEPLPPFDFHCALPSLPQAFKTTLDTIPAEVPYLTADPEAAKSCKHRVVRSGNLILAGLVWSGNAANRNDRNRSIPLSKFEPLAATNRFQFHSLQIAAPPANTGIAVIDHSAELKDFADTAALIANLDLVISVDTAVAHLAAAMGKKVWLLLPFPPDWRWLLDRADSPWYPTVRLFRQTTPGEWESVIGELARAEV